MDKSNNRFNIPPRFPTIQQLRNNERRLGNKHILTCLICNKEFDDLDKKHDNEQLRSCYCSFQCQGKSLDNIYDEIQMRKKGLSTHNKQKERNEN